MNDSRFEELLSRLLDEELPADELTELVQSAKEQPLRQTELQVQLEAAEMLAQSHDDLRNSSLFLAAVQSRLDEDPFVTNMRSALAEGDQHGGQASSGKRERTRLRQYSWWGAASAVIAVVLIASVFLFRRTTDEQVATVANLSGAVQWTGDGGTVEPMLRVGQSLAGGTLESLSAESWAELRFLDGSTATVFGQSMLTISQRQQKVLHLRRGSLSAHVAPQPAGRPMLIHTPTAKLEVLGTQFTMDAERASTTLRVNEGLVQVTRVADGSVTQVAAEQQVVASANRLDDFQATLQPVAVDSWQSNLPADAHYGDWVSGGASGKGRVRASPLLVKSSPKLQKPNLLYLVILSASRGRSPPVVLSSEVRFRIRGQIESAGPVTFGLTMQQPKGGFAGKYVTKLPAAAMQTGSGSFDVEIPVADFRAMQKSFPDSPVGLELVDWWCFTTNEDIGLEIEQVELVPRED